MVVSDSAANESCDGCTEDGGSDWVAVDSGDDDAIEVDGGRKPLRKVTETRRSLVGPGARLSWSRE